MLVAKYSINCRACGEKINIGDRIVKEKGLGVRHEICPVKTYLHTCMGGHKERIWRVGGTFTASAAERERGEPEYLTVVRMFQVEIKPSGPDDKHAGWLYTAFCREATAEEIADFRARKKEP